MITRAELARFITEFADEKHTSEDWERIAVNHYSDEKMEHARSRFVRYALGYPPSKEDEHLSLKARMIAIADTLKE